MSANEAYRIAKEIYAELGVDTEAAMARVAEIPVSMHCWQGDDVRGFENPDGDLTGGIQTTGNYPGRAKTIEQLRADFEKAASLIPGRKNINLHAIYLDNCGEHVDRDEITPKHFESWVKWAKENGFGIDFNPTYFSHKNSADGFTLSHTDAGIRRFWIDHGKACRRIAEYIGKELGTTVMDNHWVPDGMKDIPVDRYAFRQRLGRGQGVRYRRGELHRRLARVLSCIRTEARNVAYARHRSLSPDRGRFRQDILRAPLPR